MTKSEANVRIAGWVVPLSALSEEQLDARIAAQKRGDPCPNPYEVAFGNVSAQDIETMRSLPRREVPLVVVDLPEWLTQAADEDWIRVFRGGCDYLERAGTLRFSLTHAAKRQARGWFHVEEVAVALCHAVSAKDIRQAFERGLLKFWDMESQGMPVDPQSDPNLEMYGMYYCTRPVEVDKWLDATDAEKRLPRFPDGPWTKPAVSAKEASDTAVQAIKRDDLIKELERLYPGRKVPAILAEASRKGKEELKAAMLPEHGMWDRAKVLAYFGKKYDPPPAMRRPPGDSESVSLQSLMPRWTSPPSR